MLEQRKPEVKVVDVNVGVFDYNDRIADEVRKKNREDHTFMVNLMASPGAGKTTTLRKLSGNFRMRIRSV